MLTVIPIVFASTITTHLTYTYFNRVSATPVSLSKSYIKTTITNNYANLIDNSTTINKKAENVVFFSTGFGDIEQWYLHNSSGWFAIVKIYGQDSNVLVHEEAVVATYASTDDVLTFENGLISVTMSDVLMVDEYDYGDYTINKAVSVGLANSWTSGYVVSTISDTVSTPIVTSTTEFVSIGITCLIIGCIAVAGIIVYKKLEGIMR
jgi:hypothetical protein